MGPLRGSPPLPTFTVSGLNGGTPYTFTVYAADAAGNLSEPSNAVTVTTAGTPARPPITFEAEALAFSAAGASATIATETFSSGGLFPSNFRYVSLGADGTPAPPQGEYVDFTLPDVPAGTYTVVMRYKTHQANRGILQLEVDGQALGVPLNQHSAPATFRETSFGVVRFATEGDHTVRLAVAGRDATAATYTITADVFTLQPDNAAPLISAPSDMVVEATGPGGAVATYTGTATDDPDGVVPVTFLPPSGTLFPLGTTPVTATAQDFAGNTTTATFDVAVVDTTLPALTLPANRTIETSDAAGAVVTFSASAQDVVSGGLPVALSPPSGSLFALGTTTVTATATDAAGNQATGSFTVTVRVAAWSAGVSYGIGNLALYQGATWKCIQAHRSQSDWTPVRTPSLWVKVPTSDQWDYPVQYAVGTQVLFDGVGYRCRQAHTSQAAWTPAATPALWERRPN